MTQPLLAPLRNLSLLLLLATLAACQSLPRPAGFTAEARVFAGARQIQFWDASRLTRLERGD